MPEPPSPPASDPAPGPSEKPATRGRTGHQTRPPGAALNTHRLSPLRRAARRRSAAAEPIEGDAPVGAPADDGAEAEAAIGAAQPFQENPRGRLWSMVWRPGRGQLIAALILFVVGIGVVMQIRVSSADDTYTGARREDLVQLLDGLGSESRRLESEIAQLERTRTSLQSGADTQRVARAEAEKRVQVLSILAGTAPAEGPGIRMRIADPDHKVSSDVLLNAVEEMRDAGAEVIEINNTVRVVASTWFGSNAKGLVVDGTQVSLPITIEVIGDPHSLQEAAQFRGGIVSEITGPQIGGQVQIEQLDRVVVESLHTLKQNQFAQPASPPPSPR